jgi:hypothetical protein
MKTGISIIIVSYNVKDCLRDCLKSYLSQIDLNKDELVVVDNNSIDDSVKMIEEEFPQVLLIKNKENQGYARACNQGYRVTKNDLLIFSNGDIVLTPNFINLASEKIISLPQCGILGPLLTTETGDIIQACWAGELSFFGEFISSFISPSRIARFTFIKQRVIKRQRKERSVHIVVGACMLLRRKMLDQVGGMDENFELYFEDSDICYQCRKQGWEVMFVPQLVAYHGLGQSSTSMRRKIQLIYRQSQIYFYRKNNTFLEVTLLKLYLFFKFIVWKRIWQDKEFSKFFLKILLEKEHFKLNDNFILN